jgi:hypothetical protein
MQKGDDLPPDVLNEIITRLDALEKEAATSEQFRGALIGAFRAFFVVLGIRWLPDKPGESHER